MKENKLDQPKSSTQAAEQFVLTVLNYVAKTGENQAQVYPFFNANQEKLDESCLEALPLVFEILTREPLPKRKTFLQSLKTFWKPDPPPISLKSVGYQFVLFGNLIQQFPLGNRMLNLELSIAAYELALQVRTREAFPENWALTQNNLGAAYRNRIRGERAENLEKAIAAYELALQVRTREAFPNDWATTQNNLGNAYANRIRGERAENLEKAIAAYELALQVYTREAFPNDWAMAQNNLGNAYSDRIRGERAENLEKAIATYELALQVYTREAFPQDWAMTQNNLGAAYSNRLRGERAESLEKAIAAFELVLQVYTREAFPQDWANTKSNLAEVLMAIALITDNSDKLDNAITFLQSALEIAFPGSSYFIDAQYCLGNALSRRYENSHNPIDLQKALQAYKIALDAVSPEHYNRKQIWQALPTTQSILGSRLVRDGQWQEGLQLLLNSINLLKSGDDPLAHANALFQTGRAYEVLADWDNARLYYRDALRLYKHLQNQPGIAKSHTGLGGVLVSQGHLEKGVLELAKAQESYHQLEQPDKAAEVESLRQAAQRVMESQMIEVYV
jgi:tetratricopeptide (TPR) repeat protein